MHVTEIVRLLMMSHIILDAGTKSMVKDMVERIIAIANLEAYWLN